MQKNYPVHYFIWICVLVEETKKIKKQSCDEEKKSQDRLRISKRFKNQRKFLLGLLKDPDSRLNELSRIGLEEEALTSMMHFGLGEFANCPRSQTGLAKEFGLSKDMLCRRINGLLVYLGYPGTEIQSKFSGKSAKGIESRAVDARKRIRSRERKEEKKKRGNDG
jgi:hypothetical protein